MGAGRAERDEERGRKQRRRFGGGGERPSGGAGSQAQGPCGQAPEQDVRAVEVTRYTTEVHLLKPCTGICDGSTRPMRMSHSCGTGVCFKNGRWVSVDGQEKHLGRFESEEAAAQAYNARAKELHGCSVLDFLPDGSLNPNRKKGVDSKTLR